MQDGRPTGARAVLCVIPARYGASRFPGKPLALLWGKPLVQHVWERARAVPGVDELVVATDDERVAASARGFGAMAEMTSPECASGTDRVAEVARRRPAADLIVNLQGDEPELDADAVGALIGAMQADPGMRMATLAHPETDPRLRASEHVVKVAVDAEHFALYFGRRNPVRAGAREAVWRHVGVYGYTRDLLLELASWPPSAGERTERLEQLRALERGVRIKVFVANEPGTGVDTPEQLEALERRGPRPSAPGKTV